MSVDHNRWMQVALQEAQTAAMQGEVPVGAVAVGDGKLLVKDHNRCVQLSDPTAHAEILVLRRCGAKLSNYRLNGVDLYVTLEPCAMCAGALVWARIRRLLFAAKDEKSGAVTSRAALLTPGLFNHHVEVVPGILAGPARRFLQEFFAERRKEQQRLAVSANDKGIEEAAPETVSTFL